MQAAADTADRNQQTDGRQTRAASVAHGTRNPDRRTSRRHTASHGRSRQERYERGTRSYTMSHIRGKDTTIEVLVRSYLFARGLRFRKNDKRYPGHPDVVLPKWHTIVFINGCFWHAHSNCSVFSRPKSNVEFWSAKLLRNTERDERQHAQLVAAGWHVIVVWECELAKPVREARLAKLYDQITAMPGTEPGVIDDTIPAKSHNNQPTAEPDDTMQPR